MIEKMYAFDNEKVCLLPRLSMCELLEVCGLVRTVCSRSIDVMLVLKRDHVSLVHSLFGDLRNLRFTCVDAWHGPELHTTLGAKGYKLIPLPSTRDVNVYDVLGIDRSIMHTAFDIRRNLVAEQALFGRVKQAVGTTFVVVHDAPARRLKPKALRSVTLPIVRVEDFHTPNIFDWIGVLDHAIELHGIDCWVMVLADILALRPRKYVHAYACSKLPRHYRDAILVW